MDRADWCQTFLQTYRPDALRVLDFAHAADHLSDLLEALELMGVRFPTRMLARCLHVLKQRVSPIHCCSWRLACLRACKSTHLSRGMRMIVRHNY